MSSLAARPARLYSTVALAEMVTWTLLLLGMLGRYALDLGDLGVRLGGGLHGLVFLTYCLVTVLIAVDQRWSPRDLVMGLASSALPFATVPFERYAERRGLLGEVWRLREEPAGAPHERLVSVALRKPLLAAVAAALVVGLVFAGLLQAGPPTQWFD